jgi:SAM-dependent methyltransferase
LNDWGSGYVTDIAYRAGHYPQQSPWHLAACCLMAGTAVDQPGPDDRLHYLELGCGQGFGALLLAAGNPSWQVTAIDFNPAHVAGARRMAAQAGIANATFIEADLATLAEDPACAAIPEADVVSLHGVWSWVAQPVQAGIVRLLKARVRPGGVVHVSYNALPGWQGAIGLQRLVRQAGLRSGNRSDRQVTAGLDLARALGEADARHLRHSPIANGMLERFKNLSTDYLAHELMNGAWHPCFHADVADAMSEARLDWVGSASMTENFPELMLNEAQREIAARFDDPAMRELVKDMCVERALRSDIFVRGAASITSAARDAALGDLVIGLTVAPGAFDHELDVPVGRISMGEKFYGTVVRALENGPRRIADLLALPELAGHSRNPPELIAMLVGSMQAELVARPATDAGDTARRLNAVAARRFVDIGQLDRGLSAAPGLAAACAAARWNCSCWTGSPPSAA